MTIGFSIEQLKLQVEELFGRQLLYHKDCDELSELILKETQKRLSPSTLKRFFNLVNSTSNPSKFTINTLEEWILGKTPEIENINIVKHEPQEINYYNYAEEQSELAYKLTKARITDSDWVLRNQEFTYLTQFLESEKSIYPIVAPPGWGKTVFMLQAWNQVKASNANHLRWFFSGSLIRTNKLFSSNKEELLQMLSSNHQNEHFSKPVFLFIDGLDEIAGTMQETQEFIQHLISSLSDVIQTGRIKVIISLRVNIWPLLERELNNGYQDSVYSNHIYEQYGQNFGIRAFSTNEIDEWLQQQKLPNLESLQHKINLTDNQQSDLHIPSLLVQLKWHFDVGLSLTPVTNLRSASFRYLIEAHPFSSAMLVVVNEYLRKINYGLSGSYLPVRHFLPIIRDHSVGYQQLLKENILIEELIENKYKLPQRNVRFIHQSYENFFIAHELFERYKPLNERFVYWFNGRYSENNHFNEILSFLIDLAIEDEQYGFVELIYANIIKNRISYGKPIPANDIFYQVGYSIRLLPELQQYLERFITSTEWGHRYFIELFVDLDNLTGYYGRFLKSSLSSISNQNSGKLFIHTLLLYKGLQELNEPEINSALSEVNKASKEVNHVYPQARSLGYRALLGYLSNGQISKMLLQEIKHLLKKLIVNDNEKVSSYVAASLLLEGLFFTPYFTQVLSEIQELDSSLTQRTSELVGVTNFYKDYFSCLVAFADERLNPGKIGQEEMVEKVCSLRKRVNELRFPYKKWTQLQINKMSMQWFYGAGLVNNAEHCAELALNTAKEMGFTFDELHLNVALAEIRSNLNSGSIEIVEKERKFAENKLKKLGLKPLDLLNYRVQDKSLLQPA